MLKKFDEYIKSRGVKEESFIPDAPKSAPTSNGKEYKDELIDLKISDLTGTKHYRSRMLLCKDFIAKANLVIDPSKEFKLTDKKEIRKKKKEK